jgi:hypothetical protein
MLSKSILNPNWKEGVYNETRLLDPTFDSRKKLKMTCILSDF